MTVESLFKENRILKSVLQLKQEELEEREKRLREAQERLKSYERYNGQLEEALKLIRLRKYAPKSETLFTDDQLWFNEFEVLAKAMKAEDESLQEEFTQVESHQRKKSGRKPLPKDLPREVVSIDLPEDKKICPHDGTHLKQIGVEISSRLDVIPMQMKVIETHRLKYVCPCCEGFHIQKPPLEMIPKGIATSGTLAYIATAKFVDGMSLYHVESIFERFGVEISRGAMSHWMIKSALMSQPILNLMEDGFFDNQIAQMDETTVQVLKELGKKAQTKSYMWVRATIGEKPVVLFDYDPTRRADVAKRLLEDFKGRLQCDGFVGYDFLENNPNIIRHGCLAHVRRKFYEAIKSSKGANIAKHAVKLIDRLFKIEEEIKGKPPDEILKIRTEISAPIMTELKSWVDLNIKKVPPKSATGKALLYTQNQWKYVSRYLEDGRCQISTNFVENKIRPFVIGRKRWLFCDSVEGAKASAALYSLVETAKANGVDPYWYLRHLFEHIPKAQTLAEFEELLPWNCKTKIQMH